MLNAHFNSLAYFLENCALKKRLTNEILTVKYRSIWISRYPEMYSMKLSLNYFERVEYYMKKITVISFAIVC